MRVAIFSHFIVLKRQYRFHCHKHDLLLLLSGVYDKLKISIRRSIPHSPNRIISSHIYNLVNIFTTQLNDIKKLHVPTGLSLPIDLYEQIEQNRGDLSRSKYIEKILSAFLNKESMKGTTE
jgi:hypothetical protein